MTYDNNRHERPRMPERRRRISASTHGNSSLPYYRDGSGSAGTEASSNASWQRRAGQQQLQQRDPLDHFNYFDLGSSTTSNSQSLIDQDDGQMGVPAPPSSLLSSDSFSFDLLLSQSIESSDGFMSHSSPDSATWQTGDVLTPTSSHMGSQSDDNPLSHGQPGSYGSLYTLASSSPETMASGFSENVGVLDTSPTWSSPSGNELLHDLSMPVDYFKILRNSHDFAHNARNTSKEVTSEGGCIRGPPGWNTINSNTMAENTNWTTMDPIHVQFSRVQNHAEPLNKSQVPWNPEHPQHAKLGANAGNGAFTPKPGYPLDMFKLREQLFRTSDPVLPYFGPHGSFLVRENNHDQGKHQFPQDIRPRAYDSDSSQEPSGPHEHVFSAIAGMGVLESHRGRKRKLTPEERQRTLEVRKYGACWACHLSKTKCSPCSSGSPCEQCTRLVGKRRFCLLPCFNDSLESLYTFLVPDYLVGHFTRTNFETFIGQHATHWGTDSISVQMSWGCKRRIAVNVVALFTLGDSSELAYNHQAFADRIGSVELVRNKCAHIGIPLADMDDMKEDYRRHVEDVVLYDLPHYVSKAYDDQSSKLAERLLEGVCLWYQRGVGDDDERVLLHQAIEVHVASSILERSLILDQASVRKVQGLLGHEYPDLSAPRGAQQQIKLAFFMEQRPRIVRVLRQWGKLMRSSARAERNWATAFCVFIMLSLTMDKTIAAAYNLCEGRIKFKGRDAKTERQSFENLRRLMETDLFERCKEIFHCRYKTRKGGNERCNPVRDGTAAWRGEEVDGRTVQLVDGIQRVVRDFGMCSPHLHARAPLLHACTGRVSSEFTGHGTASPELPSTQASSQAAYTNHGRLASIFLSDF